MSTRYVVVHPEWGVLLTNPEVVGGRAVTGGVTFVWTKKAKDIKIKTAPTFASWVEFDRLSYRDKLPIPQDERKRMELKEVWPDRPNLQASPEACANAGISRWDCVGVE